MLDAATESPSFYDTNVCSLEIRRALLGLVHCQQLESVRAGGCAVGVRFGRFRVPNSYHHDNTISFNRTIRMLMRENNMMTYVVMISSMPGFPTTKNSLFA
jgi:hypothetical protein